MTYEEALAEAERNAERFPQHERDGRTWITVDGHDYPKDWFVRTAARMKSQNEI